MNTHTRTNCWILACGLCMFSALALVLAGGCPSTNGGLTGPAPSDSGLTDNGDSAGGGSAAVGSDDGDGGDGVGGDDGDGGGDEVVTFTLTMATKGEGTVDPVGGEYKKGEQVELHATPGTGWRFDHWEGGTGGVQNPLMLTMDANYSITAVFTAVVVFPITQFYAVYDPIVDSATLGGSVGRSGDYCSSICAMSSDGQRVAFGNTSGGSDRKLYVVNSNGTSPTAYDLPGTEGSTTSVAIDSDGSRVFVSDPYAANQAIYKLEAGAITTIALNTGPGSPGPTWKIYTTADGLWVYFVANGDIWRVKHDGTVCERIVDNAAVPCTDAGYGGAIGGLAVSADGGVLAFTMLVNRNYPGHMTTDAEVFTSDYGTLRQLTDDRKGGASKTNVWISGNGGTIVFTDAAALQHITIQPSGSGRRVLEGGDIFCHGALNHDGSKFLGFSPLAIVNTNGSGLLQILPPNWVVASDSLWINANGSQVFFRRLYSESPYGARLYVGWFNDPDILPGAPTIGDNSFSPSAMPRGDANAKVILSAAIHRATQVDAFEMLAGRYEGNAGNLPASFPIPKDDGLGYDEAAGDETYTAVGVPCAKVNDLNEVTIRLAAEDARHAVVVSDGVLHVGP